MSGPASVYHIDLQNPDSDPGGTFTLPQQSNQSYQHGGSLANAIASPMNFWSDKSVSQGRRQGTSLTEAVSSRVCDR
jgi:hypothetical protein